MTDEALVKYYVDLLIIQYSQKPKARAHIETLVTPVIMDQLPDQIQNSFDLATASGAQLDVLGKYIGVTRENYTTSGPVSLTDDDYRVLIKLVLIKNNSGSSLYAIESLLAANFPNQIRVSDNQAMGLNYVIVQGIGSADLLDILTNSDYLPAPMAVSVSVVIVPSLDVHYFGFCTYSVPATTVSPFNSYDFYQLTFPWLTY